MNSKCAITDSEPLLAALRRPYRYLVTVLVIYLAVFSGTVWAQTDQLWPEVDTYVHLNDNTRLFFSVQNTREDSALTGTDIGAHLDIFLKPLRNARLLASRSSDESKSRLVLFRIGYHHLFARGDSGNPEDRVIVEAAPRHPLGFGIVVADRNRADLRFTQGGFSWRYRNRVAVERTFHVLGYRFDPYLRGEVWYDSLYNKWSRTLVQVGSEFPLTKRVSLEGYYEHQNNTSTSPNQQLNGLGVILNLHF